MRCAALSAWLDSAETAAAIRDYRSRENGDAETVFDLQEFERERQKRQKIIYDEALQAFNERKFEKCRSTLRDMLASMLGTNHRYIDDAIRECSDSASTKAFINSYRVDHAARLLTDTDEPIALIAEMSGFSNRTSFNEWFRERYKMTPSEYREAAKA